MFNPKLVPMMGKTIISFTAIVGSLIAVSGAMALQSVDKPDSGDKGSGSSVESVAEQSEAPASATAAAGVSFANPVKNRWRVGVKIKGGSKSAKNFLVTIPVPVDWPEQRVQLRSEDLPPEVRSAKYRELNSGVRQLVLTIPRIGARQLIEMTATFDIETSQVLPPPDTSVFQIPKRVPREMKEYIGVSPQISYRNSKIRNQVKKLIADKENGWAAVEAIFDWVRDNIDYRNDDATDSLSVFRKKSGCSEDLVGLFVAMCRSAKIPARMVWVEGAQYAEFYLEDASGKGHWFPCSVAGRREFGSNAEPRVIMQKGDNIKVPEKEQRQKFCAEFVSGSGNVKPIVKFIRELLPWE